MQTLWNMSTTVRNPERIPQFLEIAALLVGQKWNDQSQCKFQILLIQHRKYLNEENALTFKNLSSKQIEILKDKSTEMSYAQAESIFIAKNYKDPAMRGRQSMNPLVKLGLISIDSDKIINLTDVGKKLNAHEITWEDFVLDSLLKYQLPNPITEGYNDWNIKPFIGVLHLIKKVNELCKEQGIKQKGISTDEFGIFALSLKDYTDIEKVAERILLYRKGYEAILPSSYKNNREYEMACNKYYEDQINQYLSDFNNPIENVHEYGDSMKRYLRQTKYIFLRGKYTHQYIDLEPRRMIEIESLLDNDDASISEYSKEEWITYMGTYGAYELPFETPQKLTEILKNILSEIYNLEAKLSIPHQSFTIPEDKNGLKDKILQARSYRLILQNKEIKFDFMQDTSKIDEAIDMLLSIEANKKEKLINKPSIELEKWTNIALNIINDAINIKPNAPAGDDNEPTFTAPANMPDIECYYGSFSMICEVTMLRNRDQWFNEGQPVMRHLRDFEDKNKNKPNYCLFVAPALHQDTLGTYWNAVKYEYDGFPQKIIPITIKQLAEILVVVKELKLLGKNICKENMIDFYDRCVDLNNCKRASEWPNFINSMFETWKNSLLA